jgi:alpha-L-rhamnosidase
LLFTKEKETGMNQMTRINIPVVPCSANANIYKQYDIQNAAWIWHPLKRVNETAVLLFKNEFSVEQETRAIVHVSADNRYELFLDGELVSCGPDRGDLWHWNFASYKIILAPGKHVLRALVWWMEEELPPYAQLSYRGGFILAAQGKMAPVINTGTGNWRVAEQEGWSYGKELKDFFHVIGPAYTVQGDQFFKAPVFVVPKIVMTPIVNNRHGSVKAGWHLYPSPLPEQRRGLVAPGRIRAIIRRKTAEEILPADTKDPDMVLWRNLFNSGKTVEIPARTTLCPLGPGKLLLWLSADHAFPWWPG